MSKQNSFKKSLNQLKEWDREYRPKLKRFLIHSKEKWRREFLPRAIQFLKFLRVKWKNDVLPAMYRMSDSMQSQGSKPGSEARKAHTFVMNALDGRTRGVRLHKDVKDFLLNYWCRLLLKIYKRDGAHGPAWNNALKVVDDMVKYLSVPRAPGKREKMEKIYRNLEQRFRNGVRVIAVPESAKENFFFRLAAHYEGFPRSSDQPIGMGGKAVPFSHELLVDNQFDKG